MKEKKSTYTLREFCNLLGVSEAWVYKVETYLGLRKWASNVCGKKSTYNSDQVGFFKKVGFLRTVQVGLQEIKKIYDLERKIIDFARVTFSLDEQDETSSEFLESVKAKGRAHKHEQKVAYVEVYLLEGVYGGSEGVEFSKEKYDRDKAAARKMDSLKDEYNMTLQGIQQKGTRFYQDIEENLKRLASYSK